MKQLAIGIDIGGTNSPFGLVDKDGNIFGEGSILTNQYPDINDYVSALSSGIKAIMNEIKEPFEIIGMGIGAPNANYHLGTIENAVNLLWKGVVPLRDMMAVEFPNIPIILTNDANAAAVGEMIYGGAKGMKDFVVVTLGTGLGSGFIANGELVIGHDGMAGELGHIIINRTGRVCGCGRKGCLETYASATGIKRTVFKLLADSMADSKFRDISYNDLTAKMITDAALEGDSIALEAFEYTGTMLGQALADTVTITSPEAIFLFGGLAKAGKFIFEPTRKQMELSMISIFRNKIAILPSGIDGKNAAILGASALAWQKVNK